MKNILTSILSLLLLFGLTSEQMLPCDDGADLCGSTDIEGSSHNSSDDSHEHEDGSSGDHHDGCGECGCPCHGPAVTIASALGTPTITTADYPDSPIPSLPDPGIAPPGPIPLG